MRRHLFLSCLTVTALLVANTLAQIQVEFQTDPVNVQTGTQIVFTAVTASPVSSMLWSYQGAVNLGLWSGGTSTIYTSPQFTGRVTVTSTQLRIENAQLLDAGEYTVRVISSGGTEVSTSAQLRVFDPLVGLTFVVPSVAVEGRNLTLRCTWTSGTEITVQWGKDGTTVTADSRITISGGSLIINPSRRSDAGEYTCTASNVVSAQSTSRSVTVFFGPDTPVLTVESPKDCVGEGDVKLGDTVRLTCISDSLPPASFTWQRDGQTVESSEPDSGVLSIETLSTDQSGVYSCLARNRITEETSEKITDLVIVDVCFSGGEVAGIVIGAFLALLILILLIVLIVVLVRRRRVQQRRRETVQVPKTNPAPRIVPPEPQPDVVREADRELNRGPNPPLFYAHTRSHDRLSADPQTLPRDRTQHRSPTRGPQPPRPPVNLPVAQRPIQLEQRPHHHHHHHHNHHHHRPGNGHRHGHTNAHGH
ncbi:V-set and immunoglobulin domain-containing protein 10-like isoform X2 [Gouania willdenowi]|uniref:V-set and immunoglobulin domain-containing protein 10-like isoform X2 n=1 Tax=Gouania willdenowi TaxID=441366 RepID=UPI001054902A|nr:V-set and immunoglobulin domain-containing protein 10-like isoform X2 [Gouania willdenowi]